MMRMTRAAIINLLASPFIEMARLKGMPPSRVIWHHALPNAWAPISTVIALNLAYLVVGVVVVEVVFAYPGIGQLMVTSVQTRDIPVVQACAIIFAAVYILLNLAADIGSISTNPRCCRQTASCRVPPFYFPGMCRASAPQPFSSLRPHRCVTFPPPPHDQRSRGRGSKTLTHRLVIGRSGCVPGVARWTRVARSSCRSVTSG
jgi:hypothetical protein